MEFFPQGKVIDFMKHRGLAVGVSAALMVATAVMFFVPGPRYGVDFVGGTEVQLEFKQDMDSARLRAAVEKLGYERPEVIGVEGNPREYIIRISDVSALSAAEQKKVESGLGNALAGTGVERLTWSPGGDKVSVDLLADVPPEQLQGALDSLGVKVRAITKFGKDEDHRYEAQLIGVADKLVAQLGETLGASGPEFPKRVEWVGPKAGAQLRDAAIQSLIYSILFIMVYVAFRFDVRFAPGGVIALIHDAVLTAGFVIAMQLEFNLQTVAALLTIVGFSINDTIVTFDRIRENMGRLKDSSLSDLINLSTSQMLSRTIITSGVAILSLSAFLFWGTPVIRELSLTLIIGFIIGVYSSIYIAAPITEWLDRKVFSKAAAKAAA